ncbi:MAG: glucosamine-6-phosphate deaminase [Candidatus Wallbacteria bacterium]|nr:glucosamine-6-phosphate deaminase [Candidatus Wallbacteria bacterium]
MEIIILETSAQVAERGAQIVCELVRKQPDSVLGLATGSTPMALYERLIEKHKTNGVSFSSVTTFNLDEYVGLDPQHPQSYRYFMNKNLFEHIDIKPQNTHIPPGNLDNPLAAGPQYEDQIRQAGGIDLQILGIGANGHIGFNEPTSSLGSRTRIKTLTKKTIDDNSRFFAQDEFQPYLAVTMGIATIMESKRIILLATGWKKAEAVAETVEGPVCALCPASALQWHPCTSMILDTAAASLLKHTAYYKFVLNEQDRLVERFGDPR